MRTAFLCQIIALLIGWVCCHNLTTGNSNDVSCPPDYDLFEGHCFYVGQANETLKDAGNRCLNSGGCLVWISDLEKENLVKRYLQEKNKTKPQPFQYGWLGSFQQDSSFTKLKGDSNDTSLMMKQSRLQSPLHNASDNFNQHLIITSTGNVTVCQQSCFNAVAFCESDFNLYKSCNYVSNAMQNETSKLEPSTRTKRSPKPVKGRRVRSRRNRKGNSVKRSRGKSSRRRGRNRRNGRRKPMKRSRSKSSVRSGRNRRNRRKKPMKRSRSKSSRRKGRSRRNRRRKPMKRSGSKSSRRRGRNRKNRRRKPMKRSRSKSSRRRGRNRRNRRRKTMKRTRSKSSRRKGRSRRNRGRKTMKRPGSIKASSRRGRNRRNRTRKSMKRSRSKSSRRRGRSRRNRRRKSMKPSKRKPSRRRGRNRGNRRRKSRGRSRKTRRYRGNRRGKSRKQTGRKISNKRKGVAGKKAGISTPVNITYKIYSGSKKKTKTRKTSDKNKLKAVKRLPKHTKTTRYGKSKSKNKPLTKSTRKQSQADTKPIKITLYSGNRGTARGKTRSKRPTLYGKPQIINSKNVGSKESKLINELLELEKSKIKNSKKHKSRKSKPNGTHKHHKSTKSVKTKVKRLRPVIILENPNSEPSRNSDSSGKTLIEPPTIKPSEDVGFAATQKTFTKPSGLGSLDDIVPRNNFLLGGSSPVVTVDHKTLAVVILTSAFLLC